MSLAAIRSSLLRVSTSSPLKRSFSSSIVSFNKNLINENNNSSLEKALEELSELKLSLKLSSDELPSIDNETLETSKLIDTLTGNYNPQTLTEEIIMPNADKPLPINAELNYYAPLKHDVKFGNLKAEVIFKCFDPVNVEFFTDFALRAAYYLGLPATGAKPIKTKRERWTVIRAPFVHAKSKENFERKTHGRMIKIWDSNNEIIDLWLSYLKKNSVWGVGVKVNLYSYENLSFNEEMKNIENSKLALDNLSDTIDSLNNDINNPVSQKVLELLKDPVFTKHMSKSDIEKLNIDSK